MITKTLKEFASPIISKALATGARSSTTEVTNYGGIGDAMFKKAQLDMNMAQLTNEAAQQMYARNSANVDLKARNSLQIVDIERVRQAKHEAMVEESKDMGDMEKAMGTIQGIATGAVTGFAAGNVPGAIIGGVAGGAIAAQNYYGESVGAEKKRETGMRNQQMMGTVATLAQGLRGMYDKQQGKKAFESVSKDLAGAASAIASMGPGQARDAAMANYQAKTSAAQATLSQYFGPQESLTMMEGMRKGAPAIFSNDPHTRDQALLAQNGVAAAADPLLQSSSIEGRARLKQYHGDNNAILGRLYGSAKGNNMSNAEFSQWAGGVNPALGDEASRMYNGGISSIRQPAPSSGGTGGAQSANQVRQPQAPIPQQGRSVMQAPQVSQAPSSMVDNSQSYMLNHPGVGGGVVMDDGMGFLKDPVSSIQKMNEQGAAAAEVFKPELSRSEEARNIMAQNMGDAPQQPNAPVQPAGESQTVKDWREGTKSSDERGAMATKKIEEYNQKIEEGLSKAKDSDMMAEGGLAKGEFIRVAKSGLEGVREIMPRLPQDSAMEAMAAKLYLHGLKTGKLGSALGATVGMKGGIAGVIAGNVVGDTMDTVFAQGDILRGSATSVGAVLSEEKRDALDQYYSAVLNTIPSYVKSGDPTQVTNDEFKRTSDPFLNYGQTTGQKLRTLEMQYKKLADQSSALGEFSATGKKQFDYKTMMPIKARTKEQIGKAEQEAYNRELGRQRGEDQSEGSQIPYFDSGYTDL